MAATGRRASLLFIAAAAMVLADPPADRPHEVLRVINRVTTALAANDANEAIGPFDKSFPDYDTLRDYFSNLSASYAISNEADVIDEQDNTSGSDVTLDWTLTLQNQTTNQFMNRRQQVHVHLEPDKKGQWRILRFTPISLFNPQL